MIDGSCSLPSEELQKRGVHAQGLHRLRLPAHSCPISSSISWYLPIFCRAILPIFFGWKRVCSMSLPRCDALELSVNDVNCWFVSWFPLSSLRKRDYLRLSCHSYYITHPENNHKTLPRNCNAMTCWWIEVFSPFRHVTCQKLQGLFMVFSWTVKPLAPVKHNSPYLEKPCSCCWSRTFSDACNCACTSNLGTKRHHIQVMVMPSLNHLSPLSHLSMTSFIVVKKLFHHALHIRCKVPFDVLRITLTCWRYLLNMFWIDVKWVTI